MYVLPSLQYHADFKSRFACMCISFMTNKVDSSHQKPSPFGPATTPCYLESSRLLFIPLPICLTLLAQHHPQHAQEPFSQLQNLSHFRFDWFTCSCSETILSFPSSFSLRVDWIKVVVGFFITTVAVFFLIRDAHFRKISLSNISMVVDSRTCDLLRAIQNHYFGKPHQACLQ
jgi:hypothetical protein